MKQFHAPLTAHRSPITDHSETTYSGWPIKSEACVVMSEFSARMLVAAIDNARHVDAIAIIQSQPWFKEVRSGIRATRHLKPTDYIKLSERSEQLSYK